MTDELHRALRALASAAEGCTRLIATDLEVASLVAANWDVALARVGKVLADVGLNVEAQRLHAAQEDAHATVSARVRALHDEEQKITGGIPPQQRNST